MRFLGTVLNLKMQKSKKGEKIGINRKTVGENKNVLLKNLKKMIKELFS